MVLGGLVLGSHNHTVRTVSLASSSSNLQGSRQTQTKNLLNNHVPTLVEVYLLHCASMVIRDVLRVSTAIQIQRNKQDTFKWLHTSYIQLNCQQCSGMGVMPDSWSQQQQ